MAEEKKIISTNRKAFHDYHIFEKFEAGLQLTGSEVKGLREGRGNLKDAYAAFRDSELFLTGMHVGPYSHTGHEGHDPYRERKLLLHRREIRKLARQVSAKGYTIVPLRVYFQGGWAKVEIALAKGKRSYDKKTAIAERDRDRAMERELKGKKRA
ncbi:MAG: SsrA-binding protein SmpB [Candidatus Neomarinimicrobiota bacterium]